MGQAATKAQEAHAQAKCKPKTNKKVQEQKMKTARATGMLALPESKLKRVPSGVLELAATLRTLDLSQNRLEELPSQINTFTSLKTLKLQSNAIAVLPDMSGLTALTTLVLDSNALQSIPNKLPPNLTKLSLRGNQLREIPASVLALTQLKELDLGQNALTAVPAHFGQALPELVDLTLDDNKLQELPACLASCSKLKVLSARRNQLSGKRQPQSISSVILADSAVHIMNLEGNPMTKVEFEAMEGVEAFQHRRTLTKNKEIHGGLSTDTSVCGLE
ncbi:TPA: hypothetical protein N0F65_002110 [Lagenidium giganteum]|uniref:Leucine-rich repeat-containing protein 57 n=1 Tax=Lagenidium giganteum TaxID=4803 RepID=A0AAV2ZAA2_9STRA|nr:TPA: hypothetical protein N0F65_002110 [Lagenidium giganteum]